jgi:hypothetical protein
MKFRLKIKLICDDSSQNLKTAGVLTVYELNFGVHELLNKLERELIRCLNELLLVILFSEYILLLLKLVEGHLALLPEIFHVF